MLDFITSRWLMMVGGLLLIGAVVGLNHTFTAVPEEVNLDRFTKDWAAPILMAYTGVGQYDGDSDPSVETGRHIVFADNVVDRELESGDALYRPYKRLPHYDSKEFTTKIYRDAILFEFDSRTVRLPLPDIDRTHLWYATNADQYDTEDEAWIDARTANPLVVDYTKPLVIRRNVNAEGIWNVYISQVDWSVFPETCHRDVLVWRPTMDRDEEVTDTCVPERNGQPVFMLKDSLETRIADARLDVVTVNVMLGGGVDEATTDEKGIVTLPTPVPRDDEEVDRRRVYLVHPELQTAAALPVTYTRSQV